MQRDRSASLPLSGYAGNPGTVELHRLPQTLRAYRELRRRILDNEMPPNAQYLEQELADALGMSRTPVREAMLRLQNEKVVEILPKRGIRLLSLSVHDLAEYYQLVAGLEGQAIGNICARGLSRTDIMPLLYALSGEETALRDLDDAAWQDADEKFHRGLFILNGNRKLQEAGLAYRDIMQRGHFVALRHLDRAHKERCLRAQNELKELLLAARAAAARELHFDHSEWLRQTIIETLAAENITTL